MSDLASQPIAILTPDQVERIARAAYDAGRVAGEIPKRAWSVKETAAFLGVSTGKVYTLAANGEIPCRKIGDRYIFHPGAVAEWVANRDK